MLLSLLLTLMDPAQAGVPTDDARRVVAILDYVASDYGGAVQGGAVVSDAEYAEQKGFVADAARIAATLPPASLDVAGGMAKLQRDVATMAPAETVAADAGHLRAALVESYGVSLVPGAPLSRANGERLYGERRIPRSTRH